MARRVGVSESSLADPSFWVESIGEATRIGALLHDLAYPSQLADTFERESRPSRPWEARNSQDGDEARALLDEIDDHLVVTPFTGGRLPRSPLSGADLEVCRSTLAVSHSLQAGLRILQLAREADRIGRLHPHEAFVLEWAALAASLHDYDKMWDLRGAVEERQKDPYHKTLTKWMKSPANVDAIRISLLRDPVSYLVAFADQLQDFGRPNYALEARTDPDARTLRAQRPIASVTVAVAPGAEATLTWGYGAEMRASDPADETRLRAARMKDRGRKVKAFKLVWPTVDGWLDHGPWLSSLSAAFDPDDAPVA
jgi:hypothetical protein